MSTDSIIESLRELPLDDLIKAARANGALHHGSLGSHTHSLPGITPAPDDYIEALIGRIVVSPPAGWRTGREDALRAERDAAQDWAELMGQAVVDILGIHQDEVPNKEELLRLAQTAAARRVETADDMDALPDGTVIRAERIVEGRRRSIGYYFERRGKTWTDMDPSDRSDGEDTFRSRDVRAYCDGTITVLWTPGAGE
ncbi:hypothetical protein [Tsukamurella sp. 1534]|uniref:hypothetical protein n=1 Tax=Tsukamurella sp. 1534 TaxID=1151061 RepID=UPI00031111CB|nr:hypothetical protein [Tsukamurella sp. 1534]